MNKVLEMKLCDLKYHIFPAKRLGRCEYSLIHDQTFEFWIKIWTEAFSHAQPNHGWEDAFQKQDLITSITFHDKVIGAHLYTFYDITASSTKKSECFSFISEETQRTLLKDGFKDLMSMEYLSVDQTVRKNSLEVGFGKVLVALGGRLAEDKNLDGAIGTPVRGNKVDAMAENIGGYNVQSNFKKFGFDCDLVLMPSKPCAPSTDLKARKVVDYLWETRTDYSISYYSKLAIAS